MKLTPVKSSNVRAIGYDPETRDLHVEYPSGVYIYRGVEPAQHSALMAAESIGKHLAAHIRGRHATVAPVKQAEPDGDAVERAASVRGRWRSRRFQ